MSRPLDVALKGICVRSNAIVLCDGDGCTTAVHQQCYGVEALPEGEWRCDGCTAGLDPAASHCLLCPVAGGALRSVASLGTTVPPEGKHIPHIIEALNRTKSSLSSWVL
jgi:hypothetical protein